MRHILADPTHEHIVVALGIDGHRIDFSDGIVQYPDSRGVGEDLPHLVWRYSVPEFDVDSLAVSR